MKSLFKKKSKLEGKKPENFNKLIDFLSQDDDLEEDSLPFLSIIVPIYNCDQVISSLIENILGQNYSQMEVLFIDAGSTDSTLDIIRSIKNSKIKLYFVANHSCYEILNRGISLAKGKYINFLFPNDYYLFEGVLKHIAALSLRHQEAHLIYGGCLLRDVNGEASCFSSPFSLRLFKQGRQMTSLQSCWFHRSSFDGVGLFNTQLKWRADYDLFCRLALWPSFKWVASPRVIADKDQRGVNRDRFLGNLVETFEIMCRHFGFLSVISLLVGQRNTLRIFYWVYWKFKNIYKGFFLNSLNKMG